MNIIGGWWFELLYAFILCYKTNSYNDPTFSGKILRGYTVLANGMNTSASLYSPFHSHLIVDITGY